MNGNAIIKIGILLVGMFIGMMIIQHILTGYRNNLSQLLRFMAIGGFILGVVQPRLAIYVMVLVCGYLDLLKRTMVVFGDVYMMDVVQVLSVAPILFAGICVGLLLERIRKGELFRKGEFMIFGGTVMVGLVVLVTSIRETGSLTGGIIDGANGAAYVPMILFGSFLFPTAAEQRTYLKVLLIAFIPVAIYGIVQGAAGLSAFETAYLETGLTVHAGALGDSVIRPFSTLNSSHALSITMASLFGFALALAFTPRGARFFWLITALVCFAAVVASLTRTGIGMAVMVAAGMVLFRRKGTTVILYGSSVFALVLLIAFSSVLLDNLSDINSALNSDVESAWMGRLRTIGTFSERLMGFENLIKEREMWSLFGIGLENAKGIDGKISHDMIGMMVIKYGIVGLLLGIGVLVIGLYHAHRVVLRVRDKQSKTMATVYLGVIFGMLLSGTISGSHLKVFPLNFLFWMSIGFLIAIVRDRAANEVATKESDEKYVPLTVRDRQPAVPDGPGRMFPAGASPSAPGPRAGGPALPPQGPPPFGPRRGPSVR